MPTLDLATINGLTPVMQKVVDELEGFSNPAVALVDNNIAAAEKAVTAATAKVGEVTDYLTIAEAIEASEQSETEAKKQVHENIISVKLRELGGLSRDEFVGQVSHYREEKQRADNQLLLEKSRVAELNKRKFKLIKDDTERVKGLTAEVATTKQLVADIQAKLDSGQSVADVDHRELIDKVGKLAGLLPADSLQGEFMQHLEVNVKAAVYQQQVDKLRQDFRDKFATQLSTPGSQDSVNLTTSVGLRFGLIAKVGTEWSSNISYEVSVDDLGVITVKDAFSGGIEIYAQYKDPAEISTTEGRLKGAVESARELKYDSVDDFINAESNRVAKGFLDVSLDRNPLAIKSFVHMKKKEDKAINLRDSARAQQYDLEHKGKWLGFFGAQDTVSVPEISDVNYTTVESTTAAATLSGKVGLQDPSKSVKFQIGGKAEIKKVRERETHTIGYLEHLKERPALQEMVTLGKPHHFFVIAPEKDLYGEDATRELRDLLTIAADLSDKKAAAESAILDAQAVIDDPNKTQEEKNAAQATIDSSKAQLADIDPPLHTLRNRLRVNLEHTAAEYDYLVRLENISQMSGNTPKELKSLRKSRGTQSSVEHLKAITAQYVFLRRTYDKCFTNFEDLEDSAMRFETAMNSLEQQLKHPGFAIDAETYEKHFKAHEVKEGKKYKYKTVGSADLSLTAGASGMVSGEVERSGKWNPKTGEVTDDTHVFRAKINGAINLNTILLASAQQSDLPNSDAVAEEITAAVGDMKWTGTEVGYTGIVEWSVVKKHGQWRLKTIRMSDESSVGVGGTLPITMSPVVGLDIGLKAAHKRVRGVQQWMGTDNVDAWADTFEGLKLRRQDQDWTRFKIINESRLHKLLDNLKKTDSGMTKDMDKIFDDLGDDTLKAEWDQLVTDFRAGTATRNTVLSKFETVLDKRVEKNRAERFKDFTTRVKAQSVQEYGVQMVADEMIEFADEHGIPADQAGTVENIVSWAKNHFKTGADARSEAKFKILQKAFALEHAVVSMEDKLASHNPKQALAVQRGIINGTYFKDAYDDPKVYLQKGISGSLTRSEEDGTEWLDIDVTAEKGVHGPDDIMERINAKTGDVGARITKVKRKARDGSKVGYFEKKYRPSMVRSLFSTSKRAKIREQLTKVLEDRRRRLRELQKRRERMMDKAA